MRQEQYERVYTSVSLHAFRIGFYAGLVWGFVKILEYFFHFTQVPVQFLIRPFVAIQIYYDWGTLIIGWLAFVLFSILASLVYALFFRKALSPWVGVVYGAAWWIVLYIVVGPITGMFGWIAQLRGDTLFTDFCLFILWGLFIGYSIAFEFNDVAEN